MDKSVWYYCPQAQPSPGIYLSTLNLYYSIVSDQNEPHFLHLTSKHSPYSSGGGVPRRDITAPQCAGTLPILPFVHFGHITGLRFTQAARLSRTTIIITTPFSFPAQRTQRVKKAALRLYIKLCSRIKIVIACFDTSKISARAAGSCPLFRIA